MTDDIGELRGRMDALEDEQRQAARDGKDPNGVLFARMDERLKHVVEWSVKVDKRDERNGARLREIDKGMGEIREFQAGCEAVQETRWVNHDDEHERLESQGKLRDWIAWAGATIATAVGVKANIP